jgi:hypothetical protein
MPRKVTPWITFLKSYYEKKKKSNPNYKFSQAMKDASKEYKKK